MKYIVSVSGGLGSAEALRRTIEQHGKKNTIAVFCDVRGHAGVSHSWSNIPAVDDLLHQRFGGETADTYRFLWELSYVLDIPIHRIGDPQKRTIWAVFAQTKSLRLYSGKAFYCKASELLKRDVFYDFIRRKRKGNYSIVLGMGWDEEHRVKQAKAYWSKRLDWDVPVIAPLTEKPYVQNIDIRDKLIELGMETIPDAYAMGLEHNNCSGICVQAGQSHYAKLYQLRPEHYHYAAWMEKRIGEYIGESYTILKDERGGTTKRQSPAWFCSWRGDTHRPRE